MDAQTPASTIHFYDTQQRKVLCGLRGFEHRSSKHSRTVTCQSCVGLLHDQDAASSESSDSDAPAGEPTHH